MSTALAAVVWSQVLTGCGGEERRPADPAAASQALSQHLAGLVNETEGTLQGASEGDTLSAMTGVFGVLGGSEETAPTSALVEESGEEEPLGDALVRVLDERVFTVENYEGDGLYRIDPGLVCDDVGDGSLDPSCVQMVAQVRVRAELAGDGLDVTLVVGTEGAEPLWIELREGALALVVDLADVRAAVLVLADAAGEPAPAIPTARGVLAFTLRRHAPGDVELAVAVREALALEGSLDDGAPFALALAASDPALSLRASEGTRSLQLAADLRRFLFTAPWTSLNATSLASGTLSVDLAGLSGRLTVVEGEHRATLENLGFGDQTSRIRLDDTDLVRVDFNPEHGRRTSITASAQPDGSDLVAFAPGFDLRLEFHMQPLADAGDEVASHLLAESYRFSLLGTATPGLRSFTTDTGGERLQVAAGALELRSSNGAAVLVPAGQCLHEVGTPEPGSHPWLGQLAAGPCQ
jgi:hypothetical protein